MSYITAPQMIEHRSFEIIQEIISEQWPEYQFNCPVREKIIKRCIHTSADFDWLDILQFSPRVIEVVRAALYQKATFYTDTQMVLSGMNKRVLDRFGCHYHCYVNDPVVIDRAAKEKITRSIVAIDRAMEDEGAKIFVIGNAPTALFRLLEWCRQDQTKRPVAVIGVPVGFVGAAESKEALIESDLDYIAARGRKGGSNIAAAIINAFLYNEQI